MRTMLTISAIGLLALGGELLGERLLTPDTLFTDHDQQAPLAPGRADMGDARLTVFGHSGEAGAAVTSDELQAPLVERGDEPVSRSPEPIPIAIV